MKLLQVEGMIYTAYGVNISESKNIKLIEDILYKTFDNCTEKELDEYSLLNIKKASDILPWLSDHSGGIDEEFLDYLLDNKELNPYNLTLDYWGNTIFYAPYYPWERPEESSVTYQQVEETMNLIAKAFGVEK